MFNQPGADVVAETVERSFDRGSTAVGAGTGAAVTLLLLALAITPRSARRLGSNHKEGRRRS